MPNDADLIALWETGARKHPIDRAVLALQLACPDQSRSQLADWPLGLRNRALVELRCSAFGPNISAWLPCPKCRERLEFDLDLRQLVAGETTPPPHDQIIHFDGQSFRLPSSRTLAAAVGEGDPQLAATKLADACRVDNETRAHWTEETLEELGERMLQADSFAEISLNLTCPECSHQWSETLDIAAFVWTEIETRARQALAEVHALASAYGWTEEQTLSLSATRRAFYLEAVRS